MYEWSHNRIACSVYSSDMLIFTILAEVVWFFCHLVVQEFYVF